LEGIGDFLGVNGKVLYSRGIISSEEACERTRFTVDEKGTAPGLRGEYFTNPDFAGIPEVRTDAHVDFEWSGGPIGSNDGAGRSVRWTAYFTPNKTGRYRWLVNADASDAYRLFMGGKLAGECKAWSDRPAGAELTMEAGKAQAVKLEIMVGHAFVPHVIGLGAIVPGDMVTPEAKQLAALADAVVVCVGFNPGTESEGSDRSFRLVLGQDELVQAASAANPRTIVVLTAGGSVDATSWIDRVPAFLYAEYSGQECGRALPKILFGEFNPSGRLPFSWERRWEDNPVHDSYYVNAPANTVIYKEGVFVGYRGYEHNGVKPLFPFGHGLSYTTFEFKNLAITPATPRAGENVTVAFDVTNSGPRQGAEVAQLYLGNPTASVSRPLKELKGFARVELKPAESRRVTLTLDPRAMSFFDAQSHTWKQEPGRFTVFVGHSSAEINLQGEYNVVP